MYSYGSNRAIAAIMASTILAILMVSSVAPIVHGGTPYAGSSVPWVDPSQMPIFCDTTGKLKFWFLASSWYGVAIEIPKASGGFPGFSGLDAKNVKSSITNRYGQPMASGSGNPTPIGEFGSGSYSEGGGLGGYIWVWDEEQYWPYTRKYWWVEVDRDSGDAFSGEHWIEITSVKAPSMAGKYYCLIYYIDTDPGTTGYWFQCTSTVPYRFYNSTTSGMGQKNMGKLYAGSGGTWPPVCVPVAMREESSTISGTVYDYDYGSTTTLKAGRIQAVAVGGPLDGKAVAWAAIKSDGTYQLTGLYEGTYKLRVWGSRSTWPAYYIQDSALPITIGRGAPGATTVNIAAKKGGQIGGSIRLLDYTGTTAVTLSANSWVRVELKDAAGKTAYATQWLVASGASTINFGPYGNIFKMSDVDRIEAGLADGTYKLYAYLYGFRQPSDVSVSIAGGATISSVDLPLRQTPYVDVNVQFRRADDSDYSAIPAGEAPSPLLIELIDSTGAVKGIGIVHVDAATTSVTVRVKGLSEYEADKTASSTGFTGYRIASWSGRGSAYKMYGIPDGTYTAKAYARGYTQTTFDSVVISGASGTSVTVKLKRGGGVYGTVYMRDATGTYSVNWPTGTGLTVEPFGGPLYGYPSGQAGWYPAGTGTGVYVKVYDAAGKVVAKSAGISQQGSNTQYVQYHATGIFGRPRSIGDMQMGLQPKGLTVGSTYTIKVWSYGCVQTAADIKTITISSDAASQYDINVRLGGAVTTIANFKDSPGGSTINFGGQLKSEVTDASGNVKGLYQTRIISTETSEGTAGTPVVIRGLLDAVVVTSGAVGPAALGDMAEEDYGIPDGSYTVKSSVVNGWKTTTTGIPVDTGTSIITGSQQSLTMETIPSLTVTGGTTAGANFNMYQMGTVKGDNVKGAVTYQVAPVKLSWVKIVITQGATVITTDYTYEGKYTIRLPDGSYNATFSCPGYKSYSTTVTVRAGSDNVIEPILTETFEAIPEFPIGAAFTLITALGVALYMLRWTRRRIV
mgnify:CR=1 FL=1